jgi:hypothetical protein
MGQYGSHKVSAFSIQIFMLNSIMNIVITNAQATEQHIFQDISIGEIKVLKCWDATIQR